MKNVILKTAAILLLFFALATLYMSASVIFDLFGVREQEGNYVPFIVWANFICSLIYLPAAYGLFTRKQWTALLLLVATGILVAGFIALLFHINSGGLYEEKTVKAMVFRTVLTGLFATIAWYFISKNKIQKT